MLSVNYTLAVIDSVTEALAVLALSSTNNDDLAAWNQMVPRRIADATGAAVVLIDHVVKDITTRSRWAIGGQTKMAGLTGASYSLEVHQALGRGLRGEVRLRVGKDRPGSVRPHCGPFRKSDHTQEAARIVIDSTDGPTVVTVWPPGNQGDAGRADDFRPTNLMERVSRHVEAHPGECTKDGLTKEVTGKKTYLLLAVDILTDEGFLTVGPGKRAGSRVYTSVRQYREADDPLSDSYSDLADRAAPEHDERASGRWCGVTDFSPPKPFPGRPRSVGPEKAVPVPVPLCRGGERGTTLRPRSRGTTGNDFGNGERFHAPAQYIHATPPAWPVRFRPARLASRPGPPRTANAPPSRHPRRGCDPTQQKEQQMTDNDDHKAQVHHLFDRIGQETALPTFSDDDLARLVGELVANADEQRIPEDELIKALTLIARWELHGDIVRFWREGMLTFRWNVAKQDIESRLSATKREPGGTTAAPDPRPARPWVVDDDLEAAAEAVMLELSDELGNTGPPS